MTKEEFQSMTDDDAEKCVGKTIIFMREEGIFEKKKNRTSMDISYRKRKVAFRKSKQVFRLQIRGERKDIF